jgi:hypothetical protein
METKFADHIEELTQQSNTKRWQNEKPLPLQRELPPHVQFPIEALGDLLRPAVVALQNAIQAPRSLCAQSVLAAATLVAQSQADVEVDGRVRPLSNNFLTIAASGERKSAVDKEALFPVRKKQKELWQKYNTEKKEYERKQNQKRRRNSNIEEDSTDEDLLPPLFPMLFTEDPTLEGIVKLLAIGQPSMGLFSDEGGQFVGGHSMSQEHQLKTASGLSKLWDSGEITRVRAAADDSFIMYGKRLSTHLMMQPVVAAQFFNNPVLGGQGFLARFLPCFPDSTIGSRMYRSIDLDKEDSIIKYRDRLSKILSTELPVVDGQANELAPPVIKLSPDAKDRWISFHDKTEYEMRKDGGYRGICSFGSKSPEHALRLTDG